MPLDTERLAADVIQIIKAALVPVVTRLSSLESKLSAIPAPDATLPARLEALEAKEKGLDGKDGAIGPQGVDGPPGAAGRDGRDGLPGVPGLPGEKGLDGVNGKDGADGLGFDDFEELYDGERTFTHRWTRGERVKEFVFKVSMDLYRGVYAEGKTYERGDGVTWGGSEWYCHETTTAKPGDGSKSWTLKVKRGRDGKDGRDASSLPVVKVR